MWFLPSVTIKYVTTKQSLTKGLTELNQLGDQQQNISKLKLEITSLEKEYTRINFHVYKFHKALPNKVHE